MAGCRATKGDGDPCKGTATGSHGYCWAHAPENAAERKRAASRGGKSKPNREVRDLKQEVKGLIADVKAGAQVRADAAVMLQGHRLLKDLVELERKVKETDELETRIEELARDIGEDTKGGRRWNA